MYVYLYAYMLMKYRNVLYVTPIAISTVKAVFTICIRIYGRVNLILVITLYTAIMY